jgi:hypothetical protein
MVSFKEYEMPGSLSAEAKLDGALRAFKCSQKSFIDLAKSFGVQISTGAFSEALGGTRNLEINIIEKLFGVLARMNDLQNEIAPVPVDWGRTEQVASALTLRLLAQIDQDRRFEELANEATKQVQSVS